jgi:hypothetical protein
MNTDKMLLTAKRNKKTVWLAMIVLAGMISQNPLHAQILVQYNGDPSFSYNSSSPFAPTTVGPDVTAGDLTNVGVTGFNAPASYQTYGFGSSLDTGKYLTFTVTPDPGLLLSFDTLTIWTSESVSTDVNAAALRWSVDSFGSDLDTVSIPYQAPPAMESFDLSSLAEQSSSTTFRLYFYGNTSGPGYAVIDFGDTPGGANGITLLGAAVPEPGTWLAAVLAALALAFFGIRRRNAAAAKSQAVRAKG